MAIKWRERKARAFVWGAVFAIAGGIALTQWTADRSDSEDRRTPLTTWTADGTGSVDTSTPLRLEVVQTSSNTGLYPGGTTALAGIITNPNPWPLAVTSVTASVDKRFSSRADSTKPACTYADFTITGSSTVASPVPANSTTAGAWSGLRLTLVESESEANQDNCKGVTVPITYRAN